MDAKPETNPGPHPGIRVVTVPWDQYRAELIAKRPADPVAEVAEVLMGWASAMSANGQREITRILRLARTEATPRERQATYQDKAVALGHALAPDGTPGIKASAVLRFLKKYTGNRWTPENAAEFPQATDNDRDAFALLTAWGRPDLPSWDSLKRWMT